MPVPKKNLPDSKRRRRSKLSLLFRTAIAITGLLAVFFISPQKADFLFQRTVDFYEKAILICEDAISFCIEKAKSVDVPR
jgi:hypothetical protein